MAAESVEDRVETGKVEPESGRNASETTRTCVNCGSEFVLARSRGVQQKYCNAACRDRAEKQRYREKHRERINELARLRSASRFDRNRKCLHCGAWFIVERRNGRPQKHCSESCRRSHADIRQRATRLVIQCKACGKTIEGRRRRYCDETCRAAGYRKRRFSGTCENCGKAFVGHKQDQRCCSIKCHRSLCEDKPCSRCGKVSSIGVAGTLCIACRRASRKVTVDRKNYRRRCRIRATRHSVNDITVFGLFVRDHGRCHICRRKVNMDIYKGRHPKAATVDHLIPLSKGGTHTWNNVALAHFGCNARKHTKSGSQLLLIG